MIFSSPAGKARKTMNATMKAVRVVSPGAGYTLEVAEIPRPRPQAGEVLIKVAAAGLNRADIAQAMGMYPPPPGAPETLGLEVSGEIVELGAGVAGFHIGDRVCALLAGGGYAQFAAVSEKCVLPVPKGVELVEAAALPEVHFTVWTNLMDSARLKAGDSVLIHGGSSGIGTAAIQLCATRGHTVFATAGSAEKCAACEALGAKRAINYREEDFVEAVKAATAGRGVDVILDMVGGDYIEKNFRAAALWGRIVNIAFQKGMSAQVNFAPMMMKRLTFMATTLRARSNDEKGVIRDALLREVWPAIDAGKIKPVVDRVFPLADAGAAHNRMAKSEHVGKILLVV
jgi:NADPH:quinone reductase